jgi:hypothetical protein
MYGKLFAQGPLDSAVGLGHRSQIRLGLDDEVRCAEVLQR